MNLKDRIGDDMKAAMRARDEARLGTIRMLRAAIQRREVDERIQLDDAAVIGVVQKQIKQCQDSIEQFEKGGRQDLADKERASVEILNTYLPAQLTETELDALISEAIDASGAVSMRDMGKVIGALKARVQGRADMGAVSARVKERLS